MSTYYLQCKPLLPTCVQQSKTWNLYLSGREGQKSKLHYVKYYEEKKQTLLGALLC